MVPRMPRYRRRRRIFVARAIDIFAKSATGLAVSMLALTMRGSRAFCNCFPKLQGNVAKIDLLGCSDEVLLADRICSVAFFLC